MLGMLGTGRARAVAALLAAVAVAALALLGGVVGPGPAGAAAAAAVNSSGDTAASELMDQLLENYDRRVRPVEQWNQTVNVSMQVAFLHLQEVDIVDGTMKLNCWIRLVWHDPFLQWNPDNHGGVRVLSFPPGSVWTPIESLNIDLFNTASQFSEDSLEDKASMVYPDGTVFSSTPALVTSSCIVDIHDFPFDTQKCKLFFGGWSYSGLQMNLVPFDSGGAVTQGSFTSTEYEVKSVEFERYEVYYPCCPNEPWPTLEYTITLERYSSFFVTHAVIPLVIISLIATLVTWIDPKDTSARMTLVVTAVLLVIATQLVVADEIPQAKERTWLDNFSTYIFVISCLTCVETAVVAYWLNRRDYAPAWALQIILAGEYAKMAGTALVSFPGACYRRCCCCFHRWFPVNDDNEDAEEQYASATGSSGSTAATSAEDAAVEMHNVMHPEVRKRETEATRPSQHQLALATVRPSVASKMGPSGQVSWIRVAHALDRISRLVLPALLLIFVTVMLTKANL